MGTTYSCDRCGASMGNATDASLSASLAQGVEGKLRGPEREIEADLCRKCFLALKEFIWGEGPKKTAAV